MPPLITTTKYSLHPPQTLESGQSPSGSLTQWPSLPTPTYSCRWTGIPFVEEEGGNSWWSTLGSEPGDGPDPEPDPVSSQQHWQTETTQNLDRLYYCRHPYTHTPPAPPSARPYPATQLPPKNSVVHIPETRAVLRSATHSAPRYPSTSRYQTMRGFLPGT